MGAEIRLGFVLYEARLRLYFEECAFEIIFRWKEELAGFLVMMVLARQRIDLYIYIPISTTAASIKPLRLHPGKRKLVDLHKICNRQKEYSTADEDA